MGLREQKRAVTERAIVGAAMALFIRQGFGATTVDEIAAAADVGRRTVFRYFRSKEEILLDSRRLDRSYARTTLRRRRPFVDDVDLVMTVLTELQRRAFAVFRPEDQLILHRLSHEEPAVAARAFLLMQEAGALIVDALLPTKHSKKDRLRLRLLAMACIVAVDASVTSWVEGGMKGDLQAILDESKVLLRNGFRHVPVERR